MSLLLAGVFLHDIGKVRELGYENEFIYTDEGQLLGHLIIGVEMLTEKIRAYQEMTGESFPKEAELRLKHMIVSHHGTYEFGSPRLPMTPEAVALHHLVTWMRKSMSSRGSLTMILIRHPAGLPIRLACNESCLRE
jgi:3'-5' exoribonuclease